MRPNETVGTRSAGLWQAVLREQCLQTGARADQLLLQGADRASELLLGILPCKLAALISSQKWNAKSLSRMHGTRRSQVGGGQLLQHVGPRPLHSLLITISGNANRDGASGLCGNASCLLLTRGLGMHASTAAGSRLPKLKGPQHCKP